MKIRLIVPHANSNESPVQAYGRTIASIAGGFTAFDATGGWIKRGALIVEPVTVFDCVVKEIVSGSLGVISRRFHALAGTIATNRRQDCVYLEIDGVVEYITQ